MSNAWLVRPSPHGHNRMNGFKSGNFIAIGWPGIGDLTGKTREQIKELLSRPPYEYESLELGNAYATVDIFVNQMDIDDLVLVPDNDDIHFCMIKSDYYFDAKYDSDSAGYSHQREVEWLTSTSRNALPMDLRKSLRVHRATANLSRHYETIEAIAYGRDLPDDPTSSGEDSFVSVEYPLRPDVIATVTIPKDITRIESERLADFVRTLYFQ